MLDNSEPARTVWNMPSNQPRPGRPADPAAHQGGSGQHPLVAALTPYGQVIVHQVATALGATSTSSAAVTAAFTPVVAFHVEALDREGKLTRVASDADVVTVYLLAGARFVRHQVTRTGDRLTIAVPTSRIRRVVEQVVANRHELLLELDADKADLLVRLEGAAAPNPDEQPGSQAVGVLNGSLMHSGYQIVAPEPGVSETITAFGAALRAVLR